MKTVEDILKEKGREVWVISPHATILKALGLMAEKDVGALVVVEDDQIIGIISERDYARKIALRGKSSVNTPVKEIMTNKVYYVSRNATIQECLVLMTQQSIRHLPVIDNEKLVGIITIGDVVKAIIGEQETTITQLSDYITGKYM